METNFKKELEQLLNKYSIENESNTPDYILAQYLIGALELFNVIVTRRENWYGRGERLHESPSIIPHDGTGNPPLQYPSTTEPLTPYDGTTGTPPDVTPSTTGFKYGITQKDIDSFNKINL